MQNPDSIVIQKRFFEALKTLKDLKIIRGKATFANRYGINRLNFYKQEVAPERGLFQISWLYYLVRDYKVNARWILTGEGSMFSTRNITPKV